MKKLILTLITSLILITGSLFAYDFTDREEALIDQIVVLFQKESSSKQTQIITTLEAAQKKLTDERKVAIVDALLDALVYDQVDVVYESDVDFDAIYDDFLAQMREENMQSYIMELVSNMGETPAEITLSIHGEFSDTVTSGVMGGDIALYIDPTKKQSEGSIQFEGNDGDVEGSADVSFKTNEEYVYVKINSITVPEDMLSAEMALGLQLLQGDRLQIPLEDRESITTTDRSDIQSELQANSDIAHLEDMLTKDGVREYDATRKSTDTYIPIIATARYQVDIDDSVDYSFLQYNGEWLLQSVEGTQTEAIGTDTMYMQEKSSYMTNQVTITSPDKESLHIVIHATDEMMDMEMIVDYKPTSVKNISYPTDVVDMSEMMEQVF